MKQIMKKQPGPLVKPSKHKPRTTASAKPKAPAKKEANKK
jgi:hypothetical protein